MTGGAGPIRRVSRSAGRHGHDWRAAGLSTSAETATNGDAIADIFSPPPLLSRFPLFGSPSLVRGVRLHRFAMRVSSTGRSWFGGTRQLSYCA